MIINEPYKDHLFVILQDAGGLHFRTATAITKIGVSNNVVIRASQKPDDQPLLVKQSIISFVNLKLKKGSTLYLEISGAEAEVKKAKSELEAILPAKVPSM